MKRAPVPGPRASRLDPPAVGVHQPLRDGQAQAQARRAAPAVNLLEGHEEPGKHRRFYPIPCRRPRRANRSPSSLVPRATSRPLRRELQGVPHQVPEHLRSRSGSPLAWCRAASSGTTYGQSFARLPPAPPPPGGRPRACPGGWRWTLSLPRRMRAASRRSSIGRASAGRCAGSSPHLPRSWPALSALDERRHGGQHGRQRGAQLVAQGGDELVLGVALGAGDPFGVAQETGSWRRPASRSVMSRITRGLELLPRRPGRRSSARPRAGPRWRGGPASSSLVTTPASSARPRS